MKMVMIGILLLLASALVLVPRIVTAQQQEPVRDEDVKVGHFEDMKYPLTARLAPVQGVVVVKVRLDEEGSVMESTAISGAKYLIPDCLANSRKWRFQPNLSRSAVIIYNFRIINGLCNSVTSQFTFQPPNFVSVTSCETPLT
jgi:Gram-negative bacterial TonB protein C-terminal